MLVQWVSSWHASCFLLQCRPSRYTPPPTPLLPPLLVPPPGSVPPRPCSTWNALLLLVFRPRIWHASCLSKGRATPSVHQDGAAFLGTFLALGQMSWHVNTCAASCATESLRDTFLGLCPSGLLTDPPL